MAKYAAETSVSSERSRAEIEATLKRYGATRFLYGWDENRATVAFEAHGRRIRFLLPLPDPNAREFRFSPQGRVQRSPEGQEAAWEQACRQRWRALLLVIKAKLEAVEAGITSFEDEFLAHIVLPNGGTVSEQVRPAIAEMYRSGLPQPLLPALGDGRAA